MADEFNQDEAAAQGENPEAAASAEDSNAHASTGAAQNADASSDASAENAPVTVLRRVPEGSRRSRGAGRPSSQIPRTNRWRHSRGESPRGGRRSG